MLGTRSLFDGLRNVNQQRRLILQASIVYQFQSMEILHVPPLLMPFMLPIPIMLPILMADVEAGAAFPAVAALDMGIGIDEEDIGMSMMGASGDVS